MLTVTTPDLVVRREPGYGPRVEKLAVRDNGTSHIEFNVSTYSDVECFEFFLRLKNDSRGADDLLKLSINGYSDSNAHYDSSIHLISRDTSHDFLSYDDKIVVCQNRWQHLGDYTGIVWVIPNDYGPNNERLYLGTSVLFHTQFVSASGEFGNPSENSLMLASYIGNGSFFPIETITSLRFESTALPFSGSIVMRVRYKV